MIYDKVEASRPARLGPAGVSVAVHVLVILGLVVGGTYKSVQQVEKPVEVKFIGKGSTGAPPPPPPAGPKKTRRKPTTKMEQPKVVPQVVPPQDVPEPKEVPKDEAPAAEGGQQGGVVGGVAGGQVGGTVGATGGGGSAPPPPPEPVKVKNVPAFAMKGRVIDQPLPRIRNEAFKQSHRGTTINGLYKVCVGLDGKVYEVTPVKPIEGVDEEVMESIKEGWLYKPQETRVCFVYGFDYTFQ